MKQQLKIKDYLEWVMLAVFLLGTFKIFTELTWFDDLKPETAQDKYIFYIGLFLIAFIVLGIHELGHLITGLVQGFKFQLFVVGPLGIKREEEKVVVYWNKNFAYYGGVAATTPVDDHPDNAKRFGKLLIAGPIASLLFAVLCLVLAATVGKPLGIIFYAGGMISITIFLVTTIPSRTGMFFTDRKRFQRLITPGKAQRVELAMLSIMGKYAADDSYRNIDKEQITELTSDELPFIRFYGLYNLICYQIEMENKVDVETEEAYQGLAKEMSKSVVVAFDKELEKFKDQHLKGNA